MGLGIMRLITPQELDDNRRHTAKMKKRAAKKAAKKQMLLQPPTYRKPASDASDFDVSLLYQYSEDLEGIISSEYW